MNKISCFIALLLSAGAALTSLSAQTVITTATGNGADTFLANDGNLGPSTVHGGSTALNLRGYDNVRARVILVRFDVSGFVPSSLTDATIALNFTASNRAREWTVFGLTDEALGNWDEAATSYSNAPGILSADPGVTALDSNVWSTVGSFPVLGTTGVQNSDTVNLNLDAHLTGNTTGLVSFLFHFTSGDSNPDWWVSSKEGAVAPALNLPNAEVIPEPSTYAMIFGALALCGAFYFRRRN